MTHPVDKPVVITLLSLVEPVTVISKIIDYLMLFETDKVASHIVAIAILNICVYKYFDGRNRSLTIATKFVICMCFAFITMSIAGGVEVWRQYDCYGTRIFAR